MKNLTSSVYSFEDLILGDFLYVDKTEFIWQLIRPAKEMFFLSRPRRFGKSLTLSTLKAVFEGKKELFRGLAIWSKPYDWKSHPIIHLDMNGRDFSTPEKMEASFRHILLEQADMNGVELPETASDAMFHNLIRALHDRDGDVVLLLDEYDKPILNNIAKENVADFLAALKVFYSVIKEKSGMLRLAFITGVSKFCHVSLFSDLNNLTDITMDARYAAMLGYTQEEFEANFADRIAETAQKLSLDRAEFLREVKAWYDGFRFEESAPSVYNPVSLVKFFENGGKFSNYWFSTGTPEFLMKLVKRRKFDFESALNEPVPGIAFDAFEIDNIDPLTLLFQTGYVTIKGTVRKLGETWYELDFPNREVAGAFNTYVLNSYSGKTQTGVVKFAAELTDALENGDVKQLRKTMEVFFAGIPYDVHHKNESNFQNIFFALFRLLGIYIKAESRTNDGRIDAVAETEKFVFIFEFKLGDDDSALEQIREKQYYKQYELSGKKIFLNGVTFSTRTGQIADWRTKEA